MVKLQGSGNAFNVPPGSQLTYPPVSMPMRPTEIDQYIKRDIVNHLIPTSFLDTLGSTLSKSAQPALDLFILLANGWREVCARPFEAFYSKLLELNGFEGWTVTFDWWPIAPKDVSAEHSRALAAHGAGLLSINEARDMMGQPALDDTGLEALYAERDRLKGAVTTGAPGELGKEAAAVTTEAKRPVLDGKSDLAVSLLKEYYPDFFGIDDEG
jgi:hypothetical protein